MDYSCGFEPKSRAVGPVYDGSQDGLLIYPTENTYHWAEDMVRIPEIDWYDVLQTELEPLSGSRDSGYEAEAYQLGEVQIYVVTRMEQIRHALAMLKGSEMDNYLAVDLEWRPETQRGQINPVALIQLAVGTVVVLIHTASMGFRMPYEVQELLQSRRVVGFGWNSNDEAKLLTTFGFDCRTRLKYPVVDVQDMANSLGYRRQIGLVELTHILLYDGFQKSKRVTRSNWNQYLTPSMIRYAALDALLTGMNFRMLRYVYDDRTDQNAWNPYYE